MSDDDVPAMPLIVTKGGVPFEDQAEGIRQFKAACLAAHAATERLQRELDITNADHIALWLEANMPGSSLGWLACRIIEAHERGASAAREQALRQAAEVALDRHEQWRMPHPDDAKPGEVYDDISACRDIADAILALIPNEGGV